MTPHKHAELIKAWADGAVIQYDVYGDGKHWNDCTKVNPPHWHEQTKYRVKPEPVSSMTGAEAFAFYARYFEGKGSKVATADGFKALADEAVRRYVREQQQAEGGKK